MDTTNTPLFVQWAEVTSRVPWWARFVLRRVAPVDAMTLAEVLQRAAATGRPITKSDLELAGVPSYGSGAALYGLSTVLTKANHPEAGLFAKPSRREILPPFRKLVWLFVRTAVIQLVGMVSLLVALLVLLYLWFNYG